MSTKLTGLQNAHVGVTVGVIEVLCCQPLNYCKNMRQQGLSWRTSDPRRMYRGLGAASVNMGSCTMIQFAIDGSLKRMALSSSGHDDDDYDDDCDDDYDCYDNHHHGGGRRRRGRREEGEEEERRLSVREEMGIGFAAGATSALAGSPLTLIMIQQQVRGGRTIDTIRRISAPRHVYRGFVGVAMREGLWTCGYLCLPPVVTRTLRESYPGQFDADAKARVPAALIGGLFACYLSHPFDTIKTCMQGDIERRCYGTFTETARKIGENGYTAFYRGASFRYGRMVCAVYLIDSLQGVIGSRLYPNAFK
ncbi:hypothetical protein ACHAW5_008568 [Stephanodiscus triporus]|uniref:Mitochondrial carrier protein n=1 Tax=Stephanodiscus triporus TaxID=2934178 RepID=A0ABD3MN61_9STRA